LTTRETEEVDGRVSGEILDDDGQLTTLVAEGKRDRAREWDVEDGKVNAY
jgi:hypothetical protein